MNQEFAIGTESHQPKVAAPRLPRRSAIAAAVASCFAAGTVFANPSGMTVVGGSATTSTSGNTLTITNSPGAILNWQAFSIGANEITRFLQQSAASSVLNRVTGGNPSQILGGLQSNGKVFLINPNGIVFGAGAQINVAGLVASTLNLSNEDFLAGRMRFTETPGAGSVINNGSIRTTQGGNVYLIAPDVQNTGLITSPGGEVVLAAGKSVELVDAGTPSLRVEINAPDNQALNMGQIVADSGRIGIYAGLIKNSGAIRADSAVVGENGRIVLKATGNTTLEAGSVLSASGPTGGSITVQSGDTTIVAGAIEATGSAGAGGTVQVLGNLVGLAGTASIDASGQTGGGTVLVGGDFQGKNPDIQNAFRTFVADGAVIKADALASGDGGKVIVWADDITRFYGSVYARGGADGGGGGFVEISGKRLLSFNGFVDVSAPHGKAGSILFDPETITIVAGVGANDGEVLDGQISFGDGGEGANFVIGEAALEALSGNVTLQANNSITVGPGLTGGGLTLTNAGTTLTLEAGNLITIDSPVTTDGYMRFYANNMAINQDITSLNDSIYLIPVNFSGTNINLGGADGAGVLGLSVAELNRVHVGAANVLQIGDGLFGGNIIVSAALLPGAGGATQNFQNLKLDTGGSIAINAPVTLAGAGNSLQLYSESDITQTGAGVITTQNLLADAYNGDVLLNAANNQVGVVAGRARNQFLFKNAQALTIGEVYGYSGVEVGGAEGSSSANIDISTIAGALTVQRPVRAYGADGGESGGLANILLSAPGGVTIDGPAGGRVEAYGGDGNTGGLAFIAILGGAGGVTVSGDGGEGGIVIAKGGIGYFGSGGDATVMMSRA